MAPKKPNKHQQNQRRTLSNTIKSYLNLKYIESLIFDPNKLPVVGVGIIIIELILNIFIVENVRYTEIDWIAYMQECEGFLNGTTNYSLLKGDTGPLVYPAGFVYIYTLLYFITSHGTNIRLAQYIFIAIYLVQMSLVLRLYTKARKVPPYVMVISAFTSYRIHSIYVLRLFNDPIAILFLYIALNLFVDGRWTLGSIFLSIGISVKMNILLFAPAILLMFIVNLGSIQTISQLALCGTVQLILGAPFLLTYPLEYIKGSFDFGRIFEHKWTVNYRFLLKEHFESKSFHISLLCLHLFLLVLFTPACYRFMQNYYRLRVLQAQLQPQIDAKNAENSKQKQKQNRMDMNDQQLSENEQQFLNSFEKSLQKSNQKNELNNDNYTKKSEEKYEIYFDKSVQLALLPIFLCNFIGVACARSLHYQFYVWYFHSLPYLLWFTDYNLGIKLLLLALAEYSWNTYPSTMLSSLILHFFHLMLIMGIRRGLNVALKIDKIKMY